MHATSPRSVSSPFSTATLTSTRCRAGRPAGGVLRDARTPPLCLTRFVDAVNREGFAVAKRLRSRPAHFPGGTTSPQGDGHHPAREPAQPLGGMFWFSRKTFVGSYRSLTATNFA